MSDVKFRLISHLTAA